jgi:two-component SAPR family response regulator
MLSMQERLRSKFTRSLAKIGHYYEGKEKWEKAVECYQKGIEVDNLCEEFYQSLMLCYQHLGLKAEAITAYNYCRNAMTAILNTAPSAKTKKIYSEILKEET